MYSYIYDCFLNKSKFEKTLSNIENQITDLGIKGRICRLTLLNNIKATIEEEIRKGATTIVIVGNDKTISQAIDVIVPKNVILGIIPIGEENAIAELLGIPEGENACKTLSARMIKNINLGKINDFYFIKEAIVPPTEATIKCDDKYQITYLEPKQTLHIFNYPFFDNQENSSLITEILPEMKGFFSKMFKKTAEQKSILNISSLYIHNSAQNIPVTVDGQKIIKSPVIIQKSPSKLRVIVGKNRKEDLI